MQRALSIPLRGGREGFTLLELMVALTAGAIAISSLYYVGAASSHFFKQQERVSQAQMSLRMAMNQLKRDIARAGFLASPRSEAERKAACPATGRIAAIEHADDVDTALVDPRDEHGVELDRLTLVGNYATGDEYLVRELHANSVVLQRDWQAFRRGFTRWWAGEPNQIDVEAVNSVFRTGRFMRIQTLQSDKFFVTISDAPAVPAAPGQGLQIPFDVPNAGALPVGGQNPCVAGLSKGATLAPLSRIRYQVRAAVGETQARAAAVTGPVAQLVRRELDPTVAGDADLDGVPPRVVLDHVVAFDVRFVEDDDGPPVDLQTVDTVDDAEDVRSVRITLSVRTPEQDPRFPWVPRDNGDPLTRYRWFDDRKGAARVRTLQAEVSVPNIGYPQL